MDKSEMEGVDPAAYEVLSNDEWRIGHHALTWCLYGAGLLLVLFAHPLGDAMAPKNHYAPNSFSWNPADARAIETNTKIIGGMIFAAGLVERLVLAIMDAKREK